MHAIERPHLPRISVLALAAILLAIVVLLLAAARVGDIGGIPGSASSGASAAPPAKIDTAPAAASSWSTSPFAAPFHVALPWKKPTRR